jgi:dihydrofolate reductase
MVASVDGIIAKKDNSVSWFNTNDLNEKSEEFENDEEFLNQIDCYVMGANTYLHALSLSEEYGWVYGQTPTIVLTNHSLPKSKENISFYSGSLQKIMDEKLKLIYKNIWVVEGASLVKDFIQQGLAHEIKLNILPILLGESLLFFNEIKKEKALHLLNCKAYENGMLALVYEIIGNES